MRYIDLDRVRIPDGWKARADKAIEDVANGTRIISRCSTVWSSLKETLSSISHGKCWYCESKEDRSDKDVDHFRPKSVYPWLAFDWNNYRFACTFCNRRRGNDNIEGGAGGKAAEFPLHNGCDHATCADEIPNEVPLLLDPCSPRDVGLLHFLENGYPCARYEDHALRKVRVETSIRLYNLNHPELIERRLSLANKIRRWVSAADRLFDQCDCGNNAIDEAFDGLVDSIHRAISEEAEDSTFARIIVREYQSKPWVEEVLNRA